MTTEKKLAIWMDHSSAHTIEYPGDENISKPSTPILRIRKRRKAWIKVSIRCIIKNNTRHRDTIKNSAN